MHRTSRAAVRIPAGGIVPDISCASCKPDIKGVEENALGIIWIHYDSLVVPVLGIVTSSALAISERAALGALHESPACAAVNRNPGADLAPGCIAATTVTVADNRLYLSINVIRVTRRHSNLDPAYLIPGVDINERGAVTGVHRCVGRV